MIERIRDVIRQHVPLTVDVDTLDEGADLYQVGMSSQASVTLMLAVEDEFDVEFPDAALTRSSFQSMRAIADVLATLTPA